MGTDGLLRLSQRKTNQIVDELEEAVCDILFFLNGNFISNLYRKITNSLFELFLRIMDILISNESAI